jgi:hypothetical protein
MPNGPIDSYNGNGLTLAAYLDGILQRNNELNGVATAPHKNFWETNEAHPNTRSIVESRLAACACL